MDYSLLFAIEKNNVSSPKSSMKGGPQTGTEKSSEKENFLQAHLQQSKFIFLLTFLDDSASLASNSRHKYFSSCG